MKDHNINPAALIVILVVGAVVLSYQFADVTLTIRNGVMSDGAAQRFAGALAALVAIIATTGPRNGPPAPIGPVGDNATINQAPTDDATKG